MSLQDRDRALRQIKLLLSLQLLQAYPNLDGDPTKYGMLFFGEVPDELLLQRQEAIAREESFREWLLLSEELLGSEWLAELDDEFGVSVIFVDDLDAIRAALLQQTPHTTNGETSEDMLQRARQDFVIPLEVEPLVVHSSWPALQTDETSLALAREMLQEQRE